MLVIVLLVSFFLLLFIGVPISFALSISSFTAVMTTGAIPVINLVQKTFRAMTPSPCWQSPSSCLPVT